MFFRIKSVVARAISAKLDREYDIFDTIKTSLRLQPSGSGGSLSTSFLVPYSLSRSNSSQNVTEEGQIPKIEALLLKTVFKCAKEGGIQELLEQDEEARSKYLSAVFLLKALLNPTEFVPITSKFAQIQIPQTETLNSYLEMIQERIK